VPLLQEHVIDIDLGSQPLLFRGDCFLLDGLLSELIRQVFSRSEDLEGCSWEMHHCPPNKRGQTHANRVGKNLDRGLAGSKSQDFFVVSHKFLSQLLH